MAAQVVYRGRRVLLEDGLQEAAIGVGADGKISRIYRGTAEIDANIGASDQVRDVGDHVLMPGIVDSHVHVNEPGRTEWEGYWSATRAAAAGGVTTIVDMPLNSIPPTTTLENLRTKLSAAAGKLHVDTAFWGGVVPGNQKDLLAMVSAGVVGFKCFLCPSGVDEFPHVTRRDVEVALTELRHADTVLAFHAECELPTRDQDADDAAKDAATGNQDQYSTFLRSRQPAMEVTAVDLVADLCTKYSVRCHIVHLSAAAALPIVRAAKARGAPLTAETCHHYLTLSAEAVPDRAVEYKCCPPVRGADNKELLWSALASGDLDMVVSDHSPCTPQLKHPGNTRGDFMRAWGGISSLQFGLSLFWTQARKRGFGLADVNRLMSVNPAQLAGLDKVKGRLREGMDADFVIWDPDKSFKVEESIILHKHKLTPYMGMTLNGQVEQTVVRGQTVYRRGGEFPSPCGKILLNATP